MRWIEAFDDWLYQKNLKRCPLIRFGVNIFGFLYYHRKPWETRSMKKTGAYYLKRLAVSYGIINNKDPQKKYVVLPVHMGDTFIVLGLSKKYKDIHSIKHLTVILPEKQKFLAEMYMGNGIDDYIIFDSDIADDIRVYCCNSVRAENFGITFPYERINFGSIIVHKPGNFFQDIVGSFLGDSYRAIPISNLLERPTINIAEKMIIPKKSILIVYSARTVQVDYQVFSLTAKMLSLMNYTVYTNIGMEGDQPISGTKPLICRVDQLASIADRFTRIIGVESGLMNVLSLCDARLTVLDTSEREISRWGTNQLRPSGDIKCINCDVRRSNKVIVQEIIETV